MTLDAGSEIRDPGCKSSDPGSGKNIPDPQQYLQHRSKYKNGLPISSAMAAMPTRPSHPGTCTPYTTASVRLAELNRKRYGFHHSKEELKRKAKLSFCHRRVADNETKG
jgi:hypothetical protein